MNELAAWQKQLRVEHKSADALCRKITSFTVAPFNEKTSDELRNEVKRAKNHIRDNKEAYPDLPIEQNDFQNPYEKGVEKILDQINNADSELGQHLEHVTVIKRAGAMFNAATGGFFVALGTGISAFLKSTDTSTPVREMCIVISCTCAWGAVYVIPTIQKRFTQSAKKTCVIDKHVYGESTRCHAPLKSNTNALANQSKGEALVMTKTGSNGVSRRRFLQLRFSS